MPNTPSSFQQRLKQRLKRYTPEAMGLLLLPVVAALAWILLETKQANDLVVHTLGVETEISDLMTSVQAAESGNRGYLLTGDENYLNAYTSAQAAIPGKLVHLKALTSDNQEQVENAMALAEVISARVALLEEGNELRRTGGLPAAVTFIRTSGGLEAMGKVRGQIQVMRNTEQRLLRERLASSDRLVRAGLIAGGLGLVIVSLAFIAWSWNSRREFRELNELMAERRRTKRKSARCRRWKRWDNSRAALPMTSTTCSRSS